FASEKNNQTSIVADLKLLFKIPVLIANAVPVFAGFWLAVYFTEASFAANFGIFLLTIIGSTLVMAGALVFNISYDFDIDIVMNTTKARPIVSVYIGLRTVLLIGMAASIIGLVMLAFTTLEAVIYALIGWFTYVVLYTLWAIGRYTLTTVIGSISGAVTPLIGWSALAPASNIVPIVLALRSVEDTS